MVLSATPEWGGAPPVSIWGGAQIGHVSSKRARPGNVSATDAETAKYPQHGVVGTYDGQWVRVVQGSDTLGHREFATKSGEVSACCKHFANELNAEVLKFKEIPCTSPKL